MDRETIKRYKKRLRELLKKGNIRLTDEQVKFLIDLYSDEECSVGIHNTWVPYESILEDGLHNYNSMWEESNDISNTVMYSSWIDALTMYPSGWSESREDTAIILRIPNKVFSREQGIFEKLPSGNYGIPSQFIVGAFFKGKVIQNPHYEKDYNNLNALVCREDNDVNPVDRKKIIEVYTQEYNRYKNSIGNKIKTIIERIKNKSKSNTLLPAGQQEEDEISQEEKTQRQLYIEQLQEDVDNTSIENDNKNGIGKNTEINENAICDDTYKDNR
ncbi:MAG: hypothetical protein IJH12_03475 [Clostridia bacterium]|nr:hypothetical protein [Clostridia bacterium]